MLNKNKKGFTLIELIAAIVILITIVCIAVPSVTRLMKKNKDKAYETKESIILKQAKQYARDNEDFLYGDPVRYDTGYNENEKRYNGYVCNYIQVSTLHDEGYLSEFDDNATGNGKSSYLENNNKITDPRDYNHKLDDDYVLLYIKSKRGASGNDLFTGPIAAKYIPSTTNVTDLCN